MYKSVRNPYYTAPPESQKNLTDLRALKNQEEILRLLYENDKMDVTRIRVRGSKPIAPVDVSRLVNPHNTASSLVVTKSRIHESKRIDPSQYCPYDFELHGGKPQPVDIEKTLHDLLGDMFPPELDEGEMNDTVSKSTRKLVEGKDLRETLQARLRDLYVQRTELDQESLDPEARQRYQSEEEILNQLFQDVEQQKRQKKIHEGGTLQPDLDFVDMLVPGVQSQSPNVASPKISASRRVPLSPAKKGKAGKLDIKSMAKKQKKYEPEEYNDHLARGEEAESRQAAQGGLAKTKAVKAPGSAKSPKKLPAKQPPTLKGQKQGSQVQRQEDGQLEIDEDDIQQLVAAEVGSEEPSADLLSEQPYSHLQGERGEQSTFGAKSAKKTPGKGSKATSKGTSKVASKAASKGVSKPESRKNTSTEQEAFGHGQAMSSTLESPEYEVKQLEERVAAAKVTKKNVMKGAPAGKKSLQSSDDNMEVPDEVPLKQSVVSKSLPRTQQQQGSRASSKNPIRAGSNSKHMEVEDEIVRQVLSGVGSPGSKRVDRSAQLMEELMRDQLDSKNKGKKNVQKGKEADSKVKTPLQQVAIQKPHDKMSREQLMELQIKEIMKKRREGENVEVVVEKGETETVERAHLTVDERNRLKIQQLAERSGSKKMHQSSLNQGQSSLERMKHSKPIRRGDFIYRFLDNLVTEEKIIAITHVLTNQTVYRQVPRIQYEQLINDSIIANNIAGQSILGSSIHPMMHSSPSHK